MAKTIVDATGRMRTVEDSRKQQLEKQYDTMEESLRKAGKHFTKSYLVSAFNLRTPEFWAFIKLMEKRRVLGVDKPMVHMKGQRVAYSEQIWYIVDRPGTVPVRQPTGLPGYFVQGFPSKTQSRAERRRLSGSHLCDRCGTMIAGRGRHRKSARGHTQDKCDDAMVKLIHES